MKSILIESLLVIIAGTIIALAANQFSPRGLQLGRNYFPEAKASTNYTVPRQVAAGASNQARVSSERLKAKGLDPIDTEQARTFFQDPAYQQNLIVFIDARDLEHYEAGHIPGAYELNYYHPEKEFPTVLPVCQLAEKVIVYCNGGDCEDSEFTAVLLRESGVSPEKLHVYTGGIAEWSAKGLPIEKGARLSGNLGTPTQSKK